MAMEDYEDVKRKIREAIAKDAEMKRNGNASKLPVIDLSDDSDDSDSSSGSDSGEEYGGGKRGATASGSSREAKRRKANEAEYVLPLGFLEPLATVQPPRENVAESTSGPGFPRSFWKAGEYDGAPCGDWSSYSSGNMDRVRVHPKFLHSNATSHKWALGAFAELLDNSLDEVINGATFVNIDMLQNRKDGNRMLLIEDDGGGMDPDKMRQCMSLGYSEKSKEANTIGQYGNGFKTSTMRLGADVIVFSRSRDKNGSYTQSIGMLSYNFLTRTGMQDIIVPMLDYQKNGSEWSKLLRNSPADWDRNLDTIINWSPYSSESDLLSQFNLMKDRGTRVIIYNLWLNDEYQLELDFDSDINDIQLRGVNRDENNIKMAKEYTHCRHYLTYRHSLRSYVSILYLRIPPYFRIILRGKDVEHHNIVNDMMLSQEITYRPQAGGDGLLRDTNITAVVTIGFVKDAKFHIDCQGFNVYHKNRLIKPFWRIWNAAGSDGRGVIGVLEANFIEPAHDKQGFERTTVLARLEARLIQMQKTYWSSNCHRIGYAPRRNKKQVSASPDYHPVGRSYLMRNSSVSTSKGLSQNPHSPSNLRPEKTRMEISCKTGNGGYQNRSDTCKDKGRVKNLPNCGKGVSPPQPVLASAEHILDDDMHDQPQVAVKNIHDLPQVAVNGSSNQKRHSEDKTPPAACLDETESQEASGVGSFPPSSQPKAKVADVSHSELDLTVDQLKERIEKKEEELGSEREKCRSLEAQLQEAQQKIDELNREQESLIDIFAEERERRETEEDKLRNKLKEASTTINELVNKVKLLETTKSLIY